jgi:uncharacterized protein YxjI
MQKNKGGMSMKLHLKEKMFTVLDNFYVKDDKGKERYEIKRKFEPAIGLKLHIYDDKGKELACIKEKKITVRPKFRIIVDGEHTATITKKLVSLRPKYEVAELGWSIKGNLIEHDYKIVGKDGEVMRIHKGLLTLRDTFVMDFKDDKHIPEALAVVLAIDYMMDTEE